MFAAMMEWLIRDGWKWLASIGATIAAIFSFTNTCISLATHVRKARDKRDTARRANRLRAALEGLTEENQSVIVQREDFEAARLLLESKEARLISESTQDMEIGRRGRDYYEFRVGQVPRR